MITKQDTKDVEGVLRLTLLDNPEDQIILLLGLHGDQIHAVLPAYVPRVQPVHLASLQRGHVVTEEVVVAPVEEFFRSCNTIQQKPLNTVHCVTKQGRHLKKVRSISTACSNYRDAPYCQCTFFLLNNNDNIMTSCQIFYVINDTES